VFARRYTVELEPRAERELLKLPRDVQRRIVNRLLQLEEDPRPRGVVRLKGAKNRYSLRVGAYRVKYAVQDDRQIVVVIGIAHRRDAY
jgi:mRNA interferase RelE/StbE